MSRSERTASGVKPGALTSETKNAGGPIMKVTRSRSMISRARTGSHLAIGTTRRPDTARSTPLSSPEMWAIGAGQQDRVVGAEPVDRGHHPRLVQQGAVRVQRDLRLARRARRARVRPRPTRGRRATAVRDRRPAREVGLVADEHGRGEPAHHGVDVRRPGEVVDRRGHRTQTPAGPEQRDGRPTVGQLPRHRSRPAPRRGRPALRRSRRSRPRTVSCRSGRASRVSSVHGPPGPAQSLVRGWS